MEYSSTILLRTFIIHLERIPNIPILYILYTLPHPWNRDKTKQNKQIGRRPELPHESQSKRAAAGLPTRQNSVII